jgi:phenylalanyl-tRNA synthetase alpha chain
LILPFKSGKIREYSEEIMPEFSFKKLKNTAKKAIERANDLNALNKVFKKYSGRKGEFNLLLASLKNLQENKRKALGRELNLAKKEFIEMINFKREKLEKKEIEMKIKKEKIDITEPGKKVIRGTLHPLTQVKREVEEIFQSMGFSIIEGPEVEKEWYNFDALNIPRDHPARDLWDTFFLKDSELLLRTHTSPVQIRYMEKHSPPLRIIAPGRVFRYEATDASHEINFYQVEGLMVDKDVSVANFKAVIEEFLKRFFKKEVEIRLRPSFFPFVEPGFEVDARREGDKQWLEMLGAGMVHPNVFKAVGLLPKNWQGFAFGMGLDRLAMLRYKINDVRLFYSNDLRFLKQF